MTGHDFTGVLLEAEIAISMDGKGSWRDNVFIERLWRGVGQPGTVVDPQVEELPADPSALASACEVACDAVSRALEAAKLLDVDVDQFAGRARS